MDSNSVAHLRTFLKVFVLYLIPFSLTNFLVIFVKGNISKNDWYTIGVLVFCVFSFAVIFYRGYFKITKVVKIQDRIAAEYSIINAMKKLQWRLVDKYDNEFIYKSPLLKNFGFYSLKFDYSDTEIVIEGPEIYVDEVIEAAELNSKAEN